MHTLMEVDSDGYGLSTGDAGLDWPRTLAVTRVRMHEVLLYPCAHINSCAAPICFRSPMSHRKLKEQRQQHACKLSECGHALTRTHMRACMT